jgi:lysophospholipase L1-like esterase
MASKATSNKIVIFANALFNRIRKRRFKRQFKKGGPVVVAEGDSWFLFPLPGVKDTIDYISRKYIVRSLADAGDEVEDYLEKGDLLQNVKQLKPEYVLISGGGNDIVGEKIVDILIKGVKNGSQPSDYINEIFKQKMDRLKELYIYFFGEINKIESQTKIYIHGYDYIRHNPDKKTIKKGWANRYMIAAGITDISMREKIIHYLVDTFNNILKELDQNYDFVTYIDHRGTVAVDEWRDEIHPNNVGYGKVANNFLNAIKE